VRRQGFSHPLITAVIPAPGPPIPSTYRGPPGREMRRVIPSLPFRPRHPASARGPLPLPSRCRPPRARARLVSCPPPDTPDAVADTAERRVALDVELFAHGASPKNTNKVHGPKQQEWQVSSLYRGRQMAGRPRRLSFWGELSAYDVPPPFRNSAPRRGSKTASSYTKIR
jgi:hypothetical protein